jgi:hypothetical protein
MPQARFHRPTGRIQRQGRTQNWIKTLGARSVDFENAQIVIALKEAEHRPIIERRFQKWPVELAIGMLTILSSSIHRSLGFDR